MKWFYKFGIYLSIVVLFLLIELFMLRKMEMLILKKDDTELNELVETILESAFAVFAIVYVGYKYKTKYGSLKSAKNIQIESRSTLE